MASNSQFPISVGTFAGFAGANSIDAGPLDFPNQPVVYQSSSAPQTDAAMTLLPFNDIGSSMNTNATKSNGWATKEEWTKREEDIKQLYVHENKKLKEVKSLMESRYGFRATDKMYKTHIKQWGLDKKNKEPEMRAIVRKHKQRADQGKRSAIRIRGQIRHFTEIVRYYERKGASIDDIIAQQTAAPTPEAVEIFTPVPSPILTPPVLAIPEGIFRCIRDYIEGSFESGAWFSTGATSVCSSIQDMDNAAGELADLHAEFHLALSLFSKNLSDEARQSLRIITARIKRIISADYPGTLTELFCLTFTLYKYRATTALDILPQFFTVAKALLGSEHPLTRICEWFQSVYEYDSWDLVTRCVEVVAGQFESAVGPMHLSTLYSRIDLIDFMKRKTDDGIKMLQRLLGEFEEALAPDDRRVLNIRKWTASEFFKEGHYDKAVALVQKNIGFFEDPSSTNAGVFDFSWELYMLARCQHALGDVDIGIATLLQAVDLTISTWGPDSHARKWLLDLEDWYSEQGLWESAAEARERRLILFESIDIDSLSVVPIHN